MCPSSGVKPNLPKGISARKEYAEEIGRDGMRLLFWVDAEDAPEWLGKIPAVGVLRKTWGSHYRLVDGEPIWREAKELSAAGERLASPYDGEMDLVSRELLIPERQHPERKKH